MLITRPPRKKERKRNASHLYSRSRNVWEGGGGFGEECLINMPSLHTMHRRQNWKEWPGEGLPTFLCRYNESIEIGFETFVIPPSMFKILLTLFALNTAPSCSPSPPWFGIGHKYMYWYRCQKVHMLVMKIIVSLFLEYILIKKS